MRAKSIAIVFHGSLKDDELSRYRIWHCARIWKQWGIKVKMHLGVDHPVEADLVIPQIDLSVFPPAYCYLLNSRAAVVNREVVDIRKSAFSQNLVSDGDDYQGPVIVKTDANCGGNPEQATAKRRPFHERVPARSLQIFRALRKIGGRPLPRLVPILDQTDKDVPPEVQRDWTILDTYDALAATYDYPQSAATVSRWYEEAGFKDLRVTEHGLVQAVGTLRNDR